MAADIVQFPHKAPPISPVAQFIRLGETAYRRHASLFSEGHLNAKRVVIDASVIRHLKDELQQFREADVEIVLDTKAAELAAWAKIHGVARKAPWADICPDAPLGPAFFRRGHQCDIYGRIARCAVETGVKAVLAPSHFLGDPTFSGWLDIDRDSCVQLREALDANGGRDIAIDYVLVTPHLQLNEIEFRLKIMAALADLPFDNLWVRASGFGNDAGAQPVARFINSLAQLHNLGKPIIVDYLGGLVGEAVVALGVASGISHGIGESERFDARRWHEPPKERDPEQPHGRARRISVAAINRSFSVAEYETLLSARGAKRLLLPPLDGSGLRTAAEVTHDPKVVASRQAIRNFEELNAVPDLHRAAHFMKQRVEPAVDWAKQVKNLVPSSEVAKAKRVNVEKLMERMGTHSKNLMRQSNALSILGEQLQDQGVSVRPIQRLSSLDKRSLGGRA